MKHDDIDSATYSVEDNKLRIYPNCRLDEELYKRIKAAGFKWAKHQDLFVAGRWTPGREDLCVDLAGEIHAEETSLADRAEAKAERLENLAHKRARQADGYFNAASKLSERFAYGQPILIGHHSERKARNDQKKIQRMTEKGVDAFNAIDYWNRRATGVEHYVNMKTSDRTRSNRIDRLMADLRSFQRQLNHHHECLALWKFLLSKKDNVEKFNERVQYYSGAHSQHCGSIAYNGAYDDLNDGSVTELDVVNKSIDAHELAVDGSHNKRWMHHLLSRISYEHSELGNTAIYKGDLTPVILQAFARNFGAEKPKATKSGEGFKLVSKIPLPAVIHLGTEVTLTSKLWCELMQSLSYTVPVKKPVKRRQVNTVPLINPSADEAKKLQNRWNDKARDEHIARFTSNAGTMVFNETVEIKQSTYSRSSKGTCSRCKTLELDIYGNRVWATSRGKSSEPVCRIRTYDGTNEASLYAPRSIIHITDKPTKPLPINWTEQQQEAEAV